jgi:hypothetical protein
LDRATPVARRFSKLNPEESPPLTTQLTAPFEQQFSHDIFKERYAFNPEEDWAGLSNRVTSYVMAALYSTPGARAAHIGVTDIEAAADRLYDLHNSRKFVAGRSLSVRDRA